VIAGNVSFFFRHVCNYHNITAVVVQFSEQKSSVSGIMLLAACSGAWGEICLCIDVLMIIAVC